MNVNIGKVTGKGAVDNGLLVLDLVFLQHLGDFLFMNVGTGKQEFLGFMFLDQFDEVGIIFLAVKDLTFSELNIFLKVIGGRFGNAEILHGFGNLDAHLLADSEIMVNGIPGSKNDCCIIKHVDPVFTEIFGRDTLNFEKFPESDIYVEFPCNFAIG